MAIPKDYPTPPPDNHPSTSSLNESLLQSVQLQKEEIKPGRETAAPLCLLMNEDDVRLIPFILEQQVDSCRCLTNTILSVPKDSDCQKKKQFSDIVTECFSKYLKSMQHEPGLRHVPLFEQYSHLLVWMICMESVEQSSFCSCCVREQLKGTPKSLILNVNVERVLLTPVCSNTPEFLIFNVNVILFVSIMDSNTFESLVTSVQM